MSRRMLMFLVTCPVVIATMVLVPTAAVGQTEATSPRTSWDAKDLQGIWTFRTVTPLERPRELADKPTLTAEEAAAYEQEEARRQNRDLIDSAQGGLNYAPESDGGIVPYNEF